MQGITKIKIPSIKLYLSLMFIVMALFLSSCSQQDNQGEILVSNDRLSAPLPEALRALVVHENNLVVEVVVDGEAPKACTNLTVDTENATFSCNIVLPGGSHTLLMVYSIMDTNYGTMEVAKSSSVDVDVVVGETTSADFSMEILTYDYDKDGDGINNLTELDEGSNPNESSYYIGGTIEGLLGRGAIIQVNGGSDLTLSRNGNFRFTPAVADMSSYAVTVRVHPSGLSQTCSVENDEGTISSATVLDVTVVCAIKNVAKKISTTEYNNPPQIDNGKVVWEGYFGDFGGSSIIFYDSAGGITLPSVLGGQYNNSPQIHNGQIVWSGKDFSGDTRVYFYDSATEETRQLDGNSNRDDFSPQIDNGLVIWVGTDNVSGASGVYFYDTAAGGESIRLANNAKKDSSPQISDGQVVWSGFDGNDDEIYLYDRATDEVKPLTNNTKKDSSPQIHNGQVVWSGFDENDNEIYLYDRATDEVKPLTNNTKKDSLPQIHNGQVVWVGNDGSDDEIFFYDHITEKTTQLTDNETNDFSPQIDHGQVVWIGFDDGFAQEIFFYDHLIGKTAQLTDNEYITNSTSPRIDNGKIVWINNYDFDNEVFFLE